jgi:hypothetical protein
MPARTSAPTTGSLIGRVIYPCLKPQKWSAAIRYSTGRYARFGSWRDELGAIISRPQHFQ